jgi:hypothetical protein
MLSFPFVSDLPVVLLMLSGQALLRVGTLQIASVYVIRCKLVGSTIETRVVDHAEIGGSIYRTNVLNTQIAETLAVSVASPDYD